MRESEKDTINKSETLKNQDMLNSPEKKERKDYMVDIFTGIRPTGDLTVANYLGAVKPIVELQDEEKEIMVFVADLHALTDHEPHQARKFTNEVVADYLALGLDPERTDIFVQSEITPEVTTLMTWLSRHISASELLRVPTLKDKLKKNSRPETANALLLLYPVMMASDIILQRAHKVPVGEDQLAHMEVTRKLIRRFNNQYGEILPTPKVLEVEAPLRLQSLRGDGKMSKTNPKGAIFLTDSPEEAADKIKRAQTAFAGKMNETLKSHILLAQELARTEEDKNMIDQIVQKHMSGEKVMGDFKQILTKITKNFLHEFQEKRQKITQDPDYVSGILKTGAKKAKQNAKNTLDLIENSTWEAS